MTKRSNTGSNLSVEDKKKPSSQELKNDMTEELVQEKHTLGLNKLDKGEINEAVKNYKWMLKIETQFEFKEERRANKENLKETSNKRLLNNAREITKNVRSSSNQAIIEKLVKYPRFKSPEQYINKLWDAITNAIKRVANKTIPKKRVYNLGSKTRYKRKGTKIHNDAMKLSKVIQTFKKKSSIYEVDEVE
ncbi:2557_t:CDS:2 [Dentiscutata heterogama]|uniref:2557_t:CDS:1 n=1 Tax=Dentiscutata heterogama TaxID=1316150 RepID=A0ACA9LHG9_9GLOM|nr:2557_t:CDS:2 [Dentiscutata heterogama]